MMLPLIIPAQVAPDKTWRAARAKGDQARWCSCSYAALSVLGRFWEDFASLLVTTSNKKIQEPLLVRRASLLVTEIDFAVLF